MQTLPIDAIDVGERHRRDFGDLEGLAASIRDNGLLHPVVVRADNRLIAGERRLRACIMLGWTEIPVTMINLEAVVMGECAENFARKDFTPSEAVAIHRAMEPIIEKMKAEARERQALAGPSEGRGAKPPTASAKLAGPVGETRDRAAALVGMKRTSLAKAEAVIDAAEANPERYADLAERLNQDGVRIEAVHREMRQRQERAGYEARADKGARVADLIEMAEAGRRFAVVYADPPWEFKVYSGKGKQRSAERYYDTSSLNAIKALPIAPLAADDCALLMWGVWPELPGALEVIEAWGFEYKTDGFLWVKQNASGDGLHTGMGYWTRANTEPCLLATKGNPLRLAQDVHQVVFAPVGEHSEKPEEVRSRIERLLAGEYLELFGRRPVPGWTVWGNEVQPLTEAAE